MALESRKENNVVSALAQSVTLPKMVKVRQLFDPDHINKGSIPAIVHKEMSRPVFAKGINRGDTVAITCGSRGVANIAVITKAIVDFVKSRGALPFVFPAMGSHGGATAEGQLAILTGCGVTEEFLGCEIRAAMDAEQIGVSSEGIPVYADHYALASDAIILCGRIKAHTAFRGPYESGLYKMAVIGMGKQRGAEKVHECGFGPLGQLLPGLAKAVFDNTKIIGGIGLVENAFDQTFKIRALTPAEITQEEPSLLEEAKNKMGQLFLDRLDVLVVDRIGKDISGDGMDPNVTGRFAVDSVKSGRAIQRIAVLDLTEETHGNCNGIGLADVTTKRLVDKVDVDVTYPNVVTSTVTCTPRIPLFTHTDEQCIKIALRTCNDIDRDNPRIVRIRDTMSLETIWVSEALLDEVKRHPNMELLGEAVDWPFNERGNLL